MSNNNEIMYPAAFMAGGVIANYDIHDPEFGRTISEAVVEGPFTDDGWMKEAVIEEIKETLGSLQTSIPDEVLDTHYTELQEWVLKGYRDFLSEFLPSYDTRH